MTIIKYPRTQHVSGSRLQNGDEDLDMVPITELAGKHIVIEEKIDGANSGISFDSAEKLHLQSRGHFLTGGPRETQFTLFKQWAATVSEDFCIALGDRYVAYGEWLAKKHTVFYDRLPHLWMEFDILDRQRSTPTDPYFLGTKERQAVLKGVPYVPVPVLWEGIWTPKMKMADFVRPSIYKSPNWREALRAEAERAGFDWALIWKHTDPSDLAEGVYIKWEENGRVMGRYKFVRGDFVSLLVSNDEHHINLPPIPNLLATGVDLFAPAAV